jgi:hypothetical protein
MTAYAAYGIPPTEPQIPEPWPASWRRVSKDDLISLIQEHPHGAGQYLTFYCRPEMRFVLYEIFELPVDVWDPSGWCDGVLVGAQTGVWSNWFLPTELGTICTVYSSTPPLGVIQYAGTGNPVLGVLGEIDLREDQ